MYRVVAFLSLLCLTLTQNLFAAVPDHYASTIPNPPRDYAWEIDKLAKKSGSFGDFYKLKLAEQQLKQGQIDIAFATVSKVKEPIYSFWKDVVLAEVYFAKNKTREVLALLKNLPEVPDYELSFGEGLYANIYKRALIARYLSKIQLGQDGNDDAGELYSLFPNDKDIESILKLEKNKPQLSLLQKIQRLHNLHARYYFKSVSGLISKSEIKRANLSKDQKCIALYELGNALRVSPNNISQSQDSFKEILKLGCDSDFKARALYWLGSLRPANSSEQSDVREQYLHRLYHDYPKHRLADDAIYKLYKMANEQNRSSEAKKYFDQLMSLKKGDMKAELVFEMAYPLFKEQKYKKAADILEKALDTEPTPDESYSRILYWYARSLEKTQIKKDQNIAKQTYLELIKNYPFSFYAILAGHRLNMKVHTPSLPDLGGSEPSGTDNYFALIDDFNDKNHHDAARAILDFLLHKKPNLEKDNQEFIAKKLIESQNYRKAIDMASKHFDGFYGPVKGAPNDPMFAALYPWAFKKQTEVGYQKNDLPLGAIEGIMREESLFQTTAKSRVGATGLMQLMPSTAALVKKKLIAEDISSDLTDPLSNILLGSTYLKDMRNYFNGQLPLAIMAYNAGPGNVNKWLRRSGNLELDEFIEDVPLSETRNYVKRVMRSMQVYGNLYNEPFFNNGQYFSFKISRTENQSTSKKTKNRRRKR